MYLYYSNISQKECLCKERFENIRERELFGKSFGLTVISTQEVKFCLFWDEKEINILDTFIVKDYFNNYNGNY